MQDKIKFNVHHIGHVYLFYVSSYDVQDEIKFNVHHIGHVYLSYDSSYDAG